MRILLCLAFLFSFFSPDYAASQEKKNTITLAPHVDPNAPRTNAEYPGGLNTFLNYITLGLKEINPKRGKVKFSFVVEKDGSLSNIEIIEGKSKKTNERVIELLNNSLKWKPATLNGEPVRISLTIPIKIN